jgi:hypothetical protein
MIKSLTTVPHLLIVQEVHEDESGATLRFQQEIQGRLARGDANYETHVRLARRSQERQHPLGVSLSERQTVADLIRVDNDIPMELCEEAVGVRVFFQGHDGVFLLRSDHPEAARLRAVLGEAVQRKARVWFIAQKPDLALLDILPAGWVKEKGSVVYFKNVFLVPHIYLEFRNKKSLEVHFNDPTTVVTIREWEKNSSDSRVLSDSAECDAVCEREPSNKVLTMFAAIAEDRLPEGSDVNEARRLRYVDEDGKIRSNSRGINLLKYYPLPFQTFAEDIHTQLHDCASKVVGITRWRMARPQGQEAIRLVEAYFSFDRQLWKPMPANYLRGFDYLVFEPISESLETEIRSMLRNGYSEPLGHILFREAWSSRFSNPKSSLLIAIAAAEVGFKQFVSQLVPQAQWLLEHSPLPPLEKMLREYLPLLLANQLGNQLSIPDSIREEIHKGVSLRDQIAHCDADFSSETIYSILMAVSDLLWILDYFSGHTWALQQIRPETQKALSDSDNTS